jgi:hypothetical protein
MVEIDHVFILTPKGGDAADPLVQAGFMEGAPNRHPCQGTACRRFFFRNLMLELLWVENESEVRGPAACDLHLWERWAGQPGDASPFGIILRAGVECPFSSWSYRPPGMPGLHLEIASGPRPDEPFWAWLPEGRSPANLDAPVVTNVVLYGPPPRAESVTTAMAARGLVEMRDGAWLLELGFEGARLETPIDFRPLLPLVCRR